MKVVKVSKENYKSVYTLNTWTDEKKEEVRKLLEGGYYVTLASSATGHTLSEMVENDGIKWVVEEYGDKVEKVKIAGVWLYDCFLHLKDK